MRIWLSFLALLSSTAPVLAESASQNCKILIGPLSSSNQSVRYLYDVLKESGTMTSSVVTNGSFGSEESASLLQLADAIQKLTNEMGDYLMVAENTEDTIRSCARK